MRPSPEVTAVLNLEILRVLDVLASTRCTRTASTQSTCSILSLKYLTPGCWEHPWNVFVHVLCNFEYSGTLFYDYSTIYSVSCSLWLVAQSSEHENPHRSRVRAYVRIVCSGIRVVVALYTMQLLSLFSCVSTKSQHTTSSQLTHCLFIILLSTLLRKI